MPGDIDDVPPLTSVPPKPFVWEPSYSRSPTAYERDRNMNLDYFGRILFLVFFRHWRGGLRIEGALLALLALLRCFPGRFYQPRAPPCTSAQPAASLSRFLHGGRFMQLQ